MRRLRLLVGAIVFVDTMFYAAITRAFSAPAASMSCSVSSSARNAS